MVTKPTKHLNLQSPAAALKALPKTKKYVALYEDEGTYIVGTSLEGLVSCIKNDYGDDQLKSFTFHELGAAKKLKITVEFTEE